VIVEKYVNSNDVEHEITASCKDELYSRMADIEAVNIEKTTEYRPGD
jgi:hypothetical protein